MVVFTCQHCGDPVKKPAVEKHYNTKCRFKNPHLTCVDCIKDFSYDDYGEHNECMTEAQRYSAHGTVFKEQKGKKKQERYMEVIQNLLQSKELNLTTTQRRLLEVCSSLDNVPRKPKPFENFIRSVARNIPNSEKEAPIVFSIIENAWKNETQPKISQNKENDKQIQDTTDIQEVTKNNEETHSNANQEIAGSKAKSEKSKKNERKKDFDEAMVLDDGHDDGVKDETLNRDIDDSTLDQNNIKPNNKKRKIQHDNYICKSDEEEQNKLNVSINEINGQMLKDKSKKAKKDKQKKNSLCLANEGLVNTDVEENFENNTDQMDSAIDDIKENVNKVSKKDLKKQRKREKYLAELENGTTFEVNGDSLIAEGEESRSSKKSKKKRKKLKGDQNECKAPELIENKNSASMKDAGKKNKKRKMGGNGEEVPEKKIKENVEEEMEASAVTVFKWEDVITSVLNSRADKELSLKKLGKKVVTEYQATKKDHRTYEELLAKFNKKVHKIKGVRVLRDRAKIVE